MANVLYSGSLVMTADVSSAKAQLKDLQSSLDGLLKNSHNTSPLGLTTEINQALSKVADLKVALDSAMNTNTGKLDLSKFNTSLKNSKTSIQDYAKSLQSLGPAGQQAFSQLAQSIMSAEVPLKKTNKLLSDFKTTLSNTVKWQISSSMVNSLFGAMQHAYGYAKDLNKSLNNIRIVTGYNAEQMAKFAKEANNAAKALSTTTIQYTDASLIYYQQGLPEKDIKARADATIKMANVTGESAKAVSDYMTAIWNNFDDGSKSIEYYADVMTALGAATASSTDEIAAGLEKFAAVSETVGLSYEYATAALATVTAETRQSADVVGNSFKTLFSRIQGLNLGETMDDGTTLNKYSQALAKVGIDIKDTTGEIKAMDIILDELGTKWGTLSNDTQMALAQAVAGVRQYNQLISLMENWDTFKINLEVAENAEGELQKQADIYAESWQAAADRVEAAFEDIYDSVLNDDFFIKLTNGVGKFVDAIGTSIDSIGGMKGVVLGLSSVLLKLFGKDLTSIFQNTVFNSKKAMKDATDLRNETIKYLQDFSSNKKGFDNTANQAAYQAQAQIQNSILEAQEKLEAKGRSLSEIEKRKAAILSDQVVLLGQQAREYGRIAQQNILAHNKNERSRNNRDYVGNGKKFKSITSEIYNYGSESATTEKLLSYVSDILNEIPNKDNPKEGSEFFNKSRKDLLEYCKALEKAGLLTTELKKIMDDLDNEDAPDSLFDDINTKLTSRIDFIDQEIKRLRNELVTQGAVKGGTTNPETKENAGNVTDEVFSEGIKTGSSQVEAVGTVVELRRAEEQGQEEILKFSGETPKISDGFMSLANSITSCVFAFQSIKGIGEIWEQEAKGIISTGEAVTSTLLNVASVAGSMVQVLNKENLSNITSLFTRIGTALGVVGKSAAVAAAGFGVVAVAVGALIAIFVALKKVAEDNYAKSLEGQLEQVRKESEQLNKSLTEVKDKTEAVQSAMEEHQKSVDILASCTAQTLEWKKALNDVNLSAAQLARDFPELVKNGTIYRDSGNLLINEESYKDYLSELQHREQAIELANIDNNYREQEILSQITYDNLIDDINEELKKEKYHKGFKDEEAIDVAEMSEIYRYGESGNELGYAILGAEIGKFINETFLNGEGYAAGVPTVEVDGIEEEVQQWLTDNADFVLQAESSDMINEALTNYLGDQSLDPEAMEALSEEIFELAETVGYASQQIENEVIVAKTQQENVIQQALNKDIYKDGEIELTNAINQENKEKIAKDILVNLQGEDASKRTEELNKFAKIMDIKSINYVSSENGKIKVEQEGEDGQIEQVDYYETTIADTIAAFEALKTVVVDNTQALDMLKQAGNATAAFLSSGNLNKVSKQEKNELFGNIELTEQDLSEEKIDSTKDKLLTNVTKYYEDLFGAEFSVKIEQLAAAKGYSSGEQFLLGMVDAMVSDQATLSKLYDNSAKMFDAVFGKELGANKLNELKAKISDFSTDIQSELVKQLNDAYNYAGEETANTLYDMIIESADPSKLLDFFKDFDFSDVDTFKRKMKELGIEIDDVDAEKFCSEMNRIADNLPISEITNFVNKIRELYSLLGKVNVGDILTTDQYMDLIANGAQLEGYMTDEGFRVTKVPENYLNDEGLKQFQGIYDTGKDNWFINSIMERYGSATGYAQNNETYDPGVALRQIMDTYKNTDFYEPLLQALNLTKDTDYYEMDETTAYEALGKYDEIFTQGKAGLYSTDQFALTSYDDLNRMSQDERFDYGSSATQYALQDYAYEGGEEYADALKDYQEAMEGLSAESPRAIELTQQFHERLKKIENNKAADNIVELQDGLKDLTGEDYEESIGKIQENLEKIFGREVSEEWIRNNQNVIKQLTTGTDEARQKAYDQIQKQITKENLIKIGFAVDLNDAEAKLNEAQSILDNADISKDMVINCVGQGDFSSLITQLQTADAEATDIAAVLAAIGATHLSPEGFQQIAEALKALQEALSNPNEENVDAAIEAFNQSFEMAMSGENPDVTPDMRQAGGTGSGSGSGSTKSSAETARDKQLQAIDDEIARSEKAREGKSPDAQHDAIMKEIELLEEQQKILEEQTDQWKELMKAKVEAFNDKYASMGFEIELTDDGMIANLSELYGRLAVELEEAEDGSKEERLLENMMDDLDDAAQLQGQIDDNVASIADKEREQAEKALEDITQRIDWRVKQIDYQIELLNYYQEKLLKQAHGNKQTIEAMLEGFKYQEQEMLALFEKGDTLRQGISELNAAKAQYPDYAQMFDEQILEYQSDLIDVNMDILELRAEMEELVQNVLELALQEIDTQTQRIDKYVSMLDHFQNIIDLSGRTMLDQSLKVQIGTAKVETMVNKMGILKQQMEGLSAATKQAQDALAARRADNDESSVKFWENQVEMLKQELETATEEFLGSWEDVLEEAGNLFEMRVELAVQTMSDALSPFSSLELFQNNYNQDKTIRDQYLDDATRIYELNKLNRELNRAVTDENDLLAKSKLRDIQQQIYELQRSGVEMSQFDLEILQKKYDLQLAEIALMEAQNSKTSMRLIRDAAGNWTYAYDADEESIEDATQKYEDAIYELDQLAKEYIDDVSDQLIENQIEYKDALMDLDRNSADYQDQLLRLQEYYTNRQLYLLQELNKGVEESGIAFHDTLYGQMNDIYDYETAYDQFLTNSNTTVAELMTNYKDWQSVVEEAMNVAGTSWENFSGDMGTSLESMEDYIKALCDEISKLVDVLMSYVSTSISMVEEWQEKYSKMVDENLAKNEAVMNTDYINGGQWVSPSGIGPGGSSGGSSGGGSRPGGSFGGGTSTYPIANNNNNNNSIKGNNGNFVGGIDYYDNPYIQRSSDATSSEYTQWSGELNHQLSAIEAAELYMLQKADDVTDDLDLLASAFSPQSGLCAKWVADIIEATEGDVKRGNAWDMLLANGGIPYDETMPQNGSIVGFASNSGGYGHVMIYQDGYLYGTTGEDGQVGRISWEDYLAKGYESTRIAAPTDVEAGERAGSLARSVYVQTGGNPVSLPDDTCPKCGKRLSDCDCDQYNDNPYDDDPVKHDDDPVKPFDTDQTMAPNRTVIIRTEEGREYYKNGKLVLKEMKFDTGGYTGEWGPEGKLAWLHEKELVLNKKDTNNILDAVSIARNIDNLIYGLTSNTNWKLSNLIGQVNPMFENTPIEQRVQINAEFPGVTDQYEIQEAFANLTNDASQYLNLNKY